MARKRNKPESKSKKLNRLNTQEATDLAMKIHSDGHAGSKHYSNLLKAHPHLVSKMAALTKV